MARMSKLQQERGEPPLIKHCEDHLGLIASGRATDEAGERLPFQVVSFEEGRIEGTGVLSTLGLSNFPLRTDEGTSWLRQELVAMFRLSDGPRNMPGVLQQLGMEALRRERAFALGEVLGPRGKLREGATVSAFYVALPIYLPDSFHVCRSTPEPVVFAWLVPITDEEAEFVRTRGRDAFEDALESADPDVFDLSRGSIV